MLFTRTRLEFDMSDFEVLSLDLHVLFARGGEHVFFVQIVDTGQFRTILNPNVWGSSLPHEVPQTMLDQPASNRFRGLGRFVPILLPKAVQVHETDCWRVDRALS